MHGDARRSLGRWALVLGLLISGCSAVPLVRSQQVGSGEAQLGQQLVVDYGCVSCHVVPGVRSEPSWVGPPLTHWGQRSYIAGSLVNNEDNLVRWLTDPQSVEEGTAMPDLGVTEQDARNIAAYLLSIEGDGVGAQRIESQSAGEE
jgi:cytochrome c2